MSRSPGRSGLAIAAVAALALCPCLRAGTVMTAVARQGGIIALQPGAVQVGASRVPWADVLGVFNDGRAADALPPEVVHLRNGEAWAGEILKLGEGKVRIGTVFFGQRDLPAAAIRAIDFKPHLPPVPAGEGPSLWRAKGRPVPGSLLWIDGDRVALDTPLGVLALTRQEMRRAVYAEAGPTNAVAAGADEIALSDGTVLAGQVTPVRDGFLVKHATLGEQTVKADQWRWVRRHPAAVDYLGDQRPETVTTTPLIRQPPPAPAIETSRGLDEGALFIRRLHVWPGTTVAYRLPGAPGGKALVSALLGLAPGSRGEARVRFQVGDRVAFERVLKPEPEAPAPVLFEVEAGSVLAMAVDFEKTVRFPCSVTVDDAAVVRH